MSQPTPAECDGLCVTAADVGVSGYPDVVAYPHPGCPLHAPGERCQCGQPDRCTSYTHDPEYVRCRCRPSGYDLSGDGPADFDPTGCPVHAVAADVDTASADPEELF